MSSVLALLRRVTRNRLAALGLVLLALIVMVAAAAPLLPLADPNATAPARRLLPPFSAGAWLGTDTLGRDLLARLVWGTRLSLAVGIAASALAALVGSAIGLVAGYAGGRADSLLMRGVDVLMAFPYLLLALAIVAALGPGLLNALYAVVVANIPFFARNVRGVTAGLRHREFVDAARLSGMGGPRILLTEVLPNVLPVIVITASTTVGWMILETAGLSFLGLGSQPPQADLGSMLGEGRKALITAPHVAALPGLVVFLIVMSMNLIGDGLRDALDPRLRSGLPARPSAATRVERHVGDAHPADGALLAVSNLRTAFETETGVVDAVKGVSLRVAPGECLGIIGESGSGKSVTALSIARLVASPPGVVRDGAVRFGSDDLLALPVGALRRLRGGRIAYVFQDPLTTLHPLMRVGTQVMEAIRAHQPVSAAEAWRRTVDLFAAVRLPDPAGIAQAYPHELSGGQRQRVSIAMALANDPELIVADEPTTALDVTVQAEVLDLLIELRRQRNLAILFISHDFGVIARMCDRVAVMHRGAVVEEGDARAVLANPRHDYTRRLLAAVPVLGQPRRLIPAAATVPATTGPGLAVEVRDLSKTYPARRSLFGRSRPAVRALASVSLRVASGETLGIVGESGCGKSTLARCLVGLTRPTSGTIQLEGQPIAELAAAGPKALGRTVQYVFQDPLSSLNPRKTIRNALAAPLRFLAGLDAGARETRMVELMRSVDLDPAVLDRYPHEFSGGQAQRIAIARALAAGARIIVLDEAVSALDVSVQAQVLRLLAELKARHGLTYLFISHDLAVVQAIADRIVVMAAGAIVEEGLSERLFAAPRHPYTRGLIDAVPTLPP
ncbi:ABC transporter ATP-binding protein/permease [Azospirillum rugosum]|uniref:ABC-type glutathione transport system ATPase component/ABC-type dipeptide/oligopeptide/nickel transport system permease subunit n=1 Tax=Azospirillum rugosum TaxID=416170 RepID=A0ABS4STB1_9PROT|nr:dipeptide ABC transporter ATP-binding protein [Azospirillum rugosum]MBP2295796.1 ABC-type glutathione transport system ATPase component/ABC-type dipeptide/oligopeptide/nickel transport system permease subunit [Azospirillum rugosum]MDQ0529093.1 ABC-type glutathione transport system ATPase component/ABC-type dipeptide/oligopeptide/nickel transport system permease subunit [Azospirillum rugosum]